MEIYTKGNNDTKSVRTMGISFRCSCSWQFCPGSVVFFHEAISLFDYASGYQLTHQTMGTWRLCDVNATLYKFHVPAWHILIIEMWESRFLTRIHLSLDVECCSLVPQSRTRLHLVYIYSANLVVDWRCSGPFRKWSLKYWRDEIRSVNLFRRTQPISKAIFQICVANLIFVFFVLN